MDRNVEREAQICPSSGVERPEARVFAVVAGTPERPRLRYLPQAVAVTQEILDGFVDVAPTEVLRIAAPCSQQCRHYEASTTRCRLAERLAHELPRVAATAPPCAARRACVWFHQQGVAACLRCEQVVTRVPAVESPGRDPITRSGERASSRPNASGPSSRETSHEPQG